MIVDKHVHVMVLSVLRKLRSNSSFELISEKKRKKKLIVD
jgi:hypothetical protein